MAVGDVGVVLLNIGLFVAADPEKSSRLSVIVTLPSASVLRIQFVDPTEDPFADPHLYVSLFSSLTNHPIVRLPLAVILPLAPSSEIVDGVGDDVGVDTPLLDKKIFWIVMTALLRFVGMISDVDCARVTPANKVDAMSTLPSTRAELFELKCDEVFMCVGIIECKSDNV